MVWVKVRAGVDIRGKVRAYYYTWILLAFDSKIVFICAYAYMCMCLYMRVCLYFLSYVRMNVYLYEFFVYFMYVCICLVVCMYASFVCIRVFVCMYV